MKKIVTSLMLSILALGLLLAGGCSSLMSGEELWSKIGLDADSVPTEVEIEYLKENVGTTVYTTTMDKTMLEGLKSVRSLVLGSSEIKQPEGYAFVPSVQSTHRIRIHNRDEVLELYYVKGDDLLVWQDSRGGDVKTYDYRYFKPHDQFTVFLDGVRQLAALPGEQTGEDLVSSLELRATISPEELREEGVGVEYEVALDMYEHQKQGSFYRVLSHEDDVMIPYTKYLIVAALGEQPTDGYDITVDHIERNSYYTKVYITSESPYIGESPNPTPTYPISAVLVNVWDVPRELPVVFLDVDNNILEVQQITAFKNTDYPTAPPATPTPSDAGTGDNLEPSPTVPEVDINLTSPSPSGEPAASGEGETSPSPSPSPETE